MSEDVVAVMLPASCALINYRTGRTELRAALPAGRHLPVGAVVVEHLEEIPSWGTIEVTAALTRPPSAPWAWRLAALPVLAATAAVAATGDRAGKFHRLVRLACIGRSLPPAGRPRTQAAVHAVRWASRMMPAGGPVWNSPSRQPCSSPSPG
ncbi:hypothetical protein [Streptomyces sp. NPDC051567]|uniref:hypothetical protein n=1 Tax=Streptomyces sp. NPDC051567 TaxID=3365660 RepID=UPI0037922BD7